MKHIIKNPEPAELLAWKASDKMFLRGRPNWDRVPSAVKEVIREHLKEEQGGICCYCERYLQAADYHNEHLKPQGMSAYAQFQVDYDNLLCSCQFELEEGDPRHCGNSKGSWYDEDLFISPLDPDCESKFTYTEDGYIYPADAGDLAAIETIQRLQLDIDKLRGLRRGVLETFQDTDLSPEELRTYVRGYLRDKQDNGGAYSPFYTTIKYLYGQ